MVPSYYEYRIYTRNYETRETPDIVVFKDIFGNRRSLKVYEARYGSESRVSNLLKEVRRGGTLFLVMPKKHIRGWCLLTSRNIVQKWSLGKWEIYNGRDSKYMSQFFYAALNRAVELDKEFVKFRVSIFNYKKNALFESFFTGLGCDIDAKAKYY